MAKKQLVSIDMTDKKITNLRAGSSANDAVNFAQLGNYLDKTTGGIVTGDLTVTAGSVYVQGMVSADNFTPEEGANAEVYFGVIDDNRNPGTRAIIRAGNGDVANSISPADVIISAGVDLDTGSSGFIKLIDNSGKGAVLDFSTSTGEVTVSMPNQNVNLSDIALIAQKQDIGQSVDLEGDQSIDGIKTFIDSPIVPTPALANQAATKGYVDAHIEAIEANYVPYNGAAAPLDLTNNGLKTLNVHAPADAGNLVIGIDPQTVVDHAGYETTLSGGSPKGNADGGRVMIIAGSADYLESQGTGPTSGNGGYINLQVGAPGSGSGARGHIRIDSPGFVGAASIYINDLTAERDLALPDASGTLLASEGSTKITTGTTAPSSPAVGDLWVDTNQK